MFNEDGEYIGARYTISYRGYLFYGDSDGLNFHDVEDWATVKSFMDAYGYEEDLEFTVKDNEYGVQWFRGEWY